MSKSKVIPNDSEQDVLDDTSSEVLVQDQPQAEQPEELVTESERARRERDVDQFFPLEKLSGRIKVMDSSTIKSVKPKRVEQQIRLSNDGGTIRLWVYVQDNVGWKNVTLS